MAEASSSGSQDLGSILTQVQTLQKDKSELVRELETQRAKVEKLTEGKRAEMKRSLDTVITTWLSDLETKDESVKKQFKDGMERLVKNTAEDSGIWQVVCCASSVHAKRTEEIERLRTECNSLKTRLEGGEFARPDARVERAATTTGESAAKRPREDDRGRDIWDEYEEHFKPVELGSFMA